MDRNKITSFFCASVLPSVKWKQSEFFLQRLWSPNENAGEVHPASHRARHTGDSLVTGRRHCVVDNHNDDDNRHREIGIVWAPARLAILLFLLIISYICLALYKARSHPSLCAAFRALLKGGGTASAFPFYKCHRLKRGEGTCPQFRLRSSCFGSFHSWLKVLWELASEKAALTGKW